MKPTIYSLYLLICLLMGTRTLLAQPTNLTGTLALDATQVTAIDAAGGTLTVADPNLFATGDRVLVIQMQGASIDPSNSGSFGSITSLNGAGTYEINVVCDTRTADGEVIMENVISSGFTSLNVADAGVQLIRIPQYVDVNVTGPLTAPAWDGTTGGVLIFEVSGTVTLNADIDMSGRGFRGGAFINEPGNPLCLPPFFNPTYPDWYYSGHTEGGEKGEGIGLAPIGRRYGRGPQSNGGGGGNDHNSGGGGGSNYLGAGTGSEKTAGSCNGSFEGLGGVGLDIFVNAGGVFLGGGGGAGHGNNDQGFDGGNGGGIIFIIAGQIEGNGNSIRSSGADVPGVTNVFDGQGGGGGGGTIILNVGSLGASTLNVEASGGDGGDTDSFNNCEGPGGGGSGGVIHTNLISWSAVTNVAGGQAGEENGTFGCADNATDGGNGVVLFNFTPNLATVSSPGCVLPVELLSFEGALHDEVVELRWTSLVETNHHFYQIERRAQDQPWQALGQVYGQGESSQSLDYRWHDVLPQPGVNQYRLAYVSLDGQVSYSRTIELRYQPGRNLRLLSQRQAEQRLHGRVHLPTRQAWQLDLRSLSGQSLLHRRFQPTQAGPQAFALDLPQLAAGVYILSVRQGGLRHTQRLMWR